MSENTVVHSPEARLLAALAHGSIIIQGVGMLIGVVVYTNQRDKSPYAAFQALQAAVYQLFAMFVVIGSWIVWTGCYMLSFIPLIPMLESDPDTLPPLFWISMGSMIIPFGIMILVSLYGMIGAWQVWRGKDFRYAIFGRWLENSGMLNKKAS